MFHENMGLQRSRTHKGWMLYPSMEMTSRCESSGHAYCAR